MTPLHEIFGYDNGCQGPIQDAIDSSHNSSVDSRVWVKMEEISSEFIWPFVNILGRYDERL